MINDVSTSFSGLSLIGRVFFFTGVDSSNGLDFFFAFNSLRAFNDGKTRVKPEEVVPRRLTEKSASFIPASVTAPSVHFVQKVYKKKSRGLHVAAAEMCHPNPNPRIRSFLQRSRSRRSAKLTFWVHAPDRCPTVCHKPKLQKVRSRLRTQNVQAMNDHHLLDNKQLLPPPAALHPLIPVLPHLIFCNIQPGRVLLLGVIIV